jgi:hypothetical protein
MRKIAGNPKARKVLCTLCCTIALFVFPWYGSFLFLGEPEIPECLKED